MGVEVDEGIVTQVGDFRFTKDVADHFDSHVRKSVPFYDELQRMIVEMSDWFVVKDTIVYDLGVSTGETIRNLWKKFRLTKFPSFIGVDNSEEMLEIARSKLSGYANVTLKQHDLNTSTPISINTGSLVLLIYVLQFINPSQRLRLLADIYRGLTDNGAIILVEKIVGNNPKFNELWNELLQDMKLRNGLSLEHIKSKAQSLRGILLSYRQDQNIKLLQRAGFYDIDIFFKWYNFIGIVAVK